MRTAIVLTALKVETKHVLRHVSNVELEQVRTTVFHVGRYLGETGEWRIAVAELGPGNVSTAMAVERATQHFRPDVALFVGIAGGLKDVSVGDVVIGTKIYGYEFGKVEDDGFKPRTEFGRSSGSLVQWARAVAHADGWQAQPRDPATGESRAILPGPIAAGEKVVASIRAPLYHFLRQQYSDALAVEMEGYGFVEGLAFVEDVRGLLIRGISDLLANKAESDEAGSQDIAADAAAAVAFEVLSRLPAPAQNAGSASSPAPLSIVPTAAASVVEIAEIAPGRFAWTGAVTLADAGRLWDKPSPVGLLRIAVRPDAPPRLRHALLRLLCHAGPDSFDVEILDHDRWRRDYEDCLDQRMPVNDTPEWTASWRACPPLSPGTSALGETAAEFSRRIEAALDRWVLDALDAEIRGCINGTRAGRRYGITVEMDLGERLLELWDRWKAEMDEPTRRRFLEMLASIHDGDGKPHGLIGVGQHTLGKCLVPAAILALVVAECGNAVLHPDGSGPLKPHHKAPGNLASTSLHGHSCGVRWVGGKPMEHWLGALEELPWKCRVVILGTVHSQQDLARARQRSIGHQTPDGRLTDNSLSHPIALVFDHGFSEALEKGHKAVEQHLRDVFRARLQEQTRYLERLINPTKQETVLHD
ncbi:ABC-three component system protein [Azospirillum argentinense]